ncbi:unnamed protein product, partial [Amoebophrya sp. A25]
CDVPPARSPDKSCQNRSGSSTSVYLNDRVLVDPDQPSRGYMAVVLISRQNRNYVLISPAPEYTWVANDQGVPEKVASWEHWLFYERKVLSQPLIVIEPTSGIQISPETMELLRKLNNKRSAEEESDAEQQAPQEQQIEDDDDVCARGILTGDVLTRVRKLVTAAT